jgi:DNA primase large subunit
MKITKKLLREIIEEEINQIIAESSKIEDEVREVVSSINEHLREKFTNTNNGGTMALVSRPRVDPLEIKREKNLPRRGLKKQTVLVPIVIFFPS